jgi:hypothetical protein
MKLRTACLLVVGLLVMARSADAHIWDWMQEWSGPGPFDGVHPVVQVDCLLSGTPQRETCFFIDYRHLETVKDPSKSTYDNFPIKVDLKIVDVGLTHAIKIGRLDESIRAGAGVGFLIATGDKDQGGKRMIRPTIVFPRFMVQPAMAIAELLDKTPAGGWQKRALKIVKFHVGGELLVGPLNAESLGVSPSLSTFDRHAEYVLSKGMVIDLGELLFR